MIPTPKEFWERWSVFWITLCPDKIRVAVLQITTISITIDIGRQRPECLCQFKALPQKQSKDMPLCVYPEVIPCLTLPLSLADAKLSPTKLPSQLCGLRASGGVQGQWGRKEGASSSRPERALRYKVTRQVGLFFLLESTFLPNGSCFSRNY